MAFKTIFKGPLKYPFPYSFLYPVLSSPILFIPPFLILLLSMYIIMSYFPFLGRAFPSSGHLPGFRERTLHQCGQREIEDTLFWPLQMPKGICTGIYTHILTQAHTQTVLHSIFTFTDVITKALYFLFYYIISKNVYPLSISALLMSISFANFSSQRRSFVMNVFNSLDEFPVVLGTCL